MARLGRTDLDVYPLCLGGNVFGWTASEQVSFDILDAYAAAGGNFIDTADGYSAWVPGHQGGESETIIGRWLAARGNRNHMIVATKVGRSPRLPGLTRTTIRTGAEASLKRLNTDRIDLYYAHADDPQVPLEETLAAFDTLVREGKVRYIAASNYSAARLADALSTSARHGLASYVALQPHYNLMHRQEYEGTVAALCERAGLACLPYFALAKGFLTGKYRHGVTVESVRSEGARSYLDQRGERVLQALDDIAARRGTAVAAVALAWLLAKPTVAAPIASVTSVRQLAELLPVATMELNAAEVRLLDEASTV